MTLALYVLLLLLFLSQLVLRSAHESKIRDCSPFLCGRLEEIGFPFSNPINPECGLCVINCTGPEPKVQFHKHGKWYPVVGMDYEKQIITIHDPEVQTQLDSNRCDLLNSFTEPVSPFLSISVIKTLPFIKCKRVSHPIPLAKLLHLLDNYTSCKGYDLFYDDQNRTLPSLPESLFNHCSVVQLPSTNIQRFASGMVPNNLTLLWDADFSINWEICPACQHCYYKLGGRCQNSPTRSFECGNLCQNRWQGNLECGNLKKGSGVGRKVGIGVASGAVSILLTSIMFVLYQRHKRKKLTSSSALISQDVSSYPYFDPDHEQESIHFQTQIFTYKELEEATNHFSNNKKLGDGGFSTVYHGKLHDGRVVAVKRLFEHNYKRVQGFMNEIVILSRLCHPHLVSLYGCTKLDSSELLLVYEYVANGTVADHLHGNRANDGLLTWPIRMSIAIETADALAYLHASDIIHRDVKTNNILLDSSFHVKVADFGLSRLLPTNTTHVLTAPQGTPGYVDPEYYQCYQLNNKSDVYSLGVVLIELISSKPAVDIGRQRHEINLASMALNKIHNQALHELVDPNIGFDSDYSTRNMITLVAELAFRCLQQEKEMRPCMMEVFETLRGIQNEDYKM